MIKESDEFRAFVQSIQGGKSISDLFCGIAEKQSKFVKMMVKTSMGFAIDKLNLNDKLSLDSLYDEMLDKSKGNDAKLIELHNDFMCKNDFSLRMKSNGNKRKKRAVQKARNKDKGVEINELADLLRITIVGDLQDIKELRKIMSDKYNCYHEEWVMQKSGFLKGASRVEVDGLVAQVLLGEEDQLLRAYPLSHKLFEAIRSYDDYKITHDIETLQEIIDTYSEVRDIFNKASEGKLDVANDNEKDIEPVLEFMKKKKINFEFQEINLDSEDKDIKKSLDNLNGLHRLIHLAYIDKADEDWRNFYNQKLEEVQLNKKISNQLSL